MGEARIAHREFVCLADAAAVTARKGGGDSAGRTIDPLTDMGGERTLDRGNPGCCRCRTDNLERANRAATTATAHVHAAVICRNYQGAGATICGTDAL